MQLTIMIDTQQQYIKLNIHSEISIIYKFHRFLGGGAIRNSIINEFGPIQYLYFTCF